MSGNIKLEILDFNYFRIEFEYLKDYGYNRRVTGELKAYYPPDHMLHMAYPDLGIVDLVVVPIQKTFNNVSVYQRYVDRVGSGYNYDYPDYYVTYGLEFH